MYTFDHGLFMALNFDGGPLFDRIMLTVSGTAMWLPLYALILWLVWRRSGWRGMSVFLVLMLLALGLSDIVSGIFKHNGLLGDLLPQLEPRPRPMFTPTLEGLEITPDSLRALRSAAVPHDWAVHVPPEAVSGMYGTVSAHAATIVAVAVLSCGNPPQVVHRPDGRLHRRHLLFAHLPGQAFPDGSRMGHARGLRTGLRRPAGLPQAGTEPEQTIHPPPVKHICAEFINFARSIVQTFKNTGYEYRTQ